MLQVLSNLLGNALKFSDAGTKVVVRATNTDGTVRVSVKDAGRGISEDDRPHVFDRFWQANRTSRAGAGLGLASARASSRLTEDASGPPALSAAAPRFISRSLNTCPMPALAHSSARVRS